MQHSSPNRLHRLGLRWVFQLNTDATLGFCRNAMDMIGFGVNSVGYHNHPLYWSIIPHQTEGELTYTSTYSELEEAFNLSFSIRTCDSADCASCAKLKELRAHERVVMYLAGDACKAGKIPVDTAQYDNILGYGNFTRSVLNTDPNVCKCHPLGIYSFHSYAPVIQPKTFLQESRLPTICTFTIFRHVRRKTPSRDFYCGSLAGRPDVLDVSGRNMRERPEHADAVKHNTGNCLIFGEKCGTFGEKSGMTSVT
jgi:hypothetical protein